MNWCKGRKLWLFVSLFILVAVIVIVDDLEDVAEVEQKQTTAYLPPVSIVSLKAQNNNGVIITMAEIKPRWKVTLTSQVNGEIERVFEQAFSGKQVQKGDSLIRIEDSRYLMDLHEAEQALAEATLNLLQAQNKSSQDQKNWQRSGLHEIPSDLALNIPQLNVAQKTWIAAESRVKAMKKLLSYTHITAPFSGFITSRNVSVGQTVLEGSELLTLINSDQQEMVVALSKAQWNLLSKDWNKQRVSIRNMDGVEIAQAMIKRGGDFIDPETRQYTVFLDVNHSADRDSLTGEFVQVYLPTQTVSNSLRIPESALTRDGFVWFLDDENYLQQFFATVLFYQENQIVIKAPPNNALGKKTPSNWRIVVMPLASFLAGQRVRPVITEGG